MTYSIIGRCARTGQLGLGVTTFSLAVGGRCEGISPFDILQPAFAALTSGAYHPTAEAHAIVADHVMRHVRAVLEKENAPVVAKGVN